jgi:hypothetical protein
LIQLINPYFVLVLNLYKPAIFTVENSFSHDVRRVQQRVTEECCKHCMQSLEESSGGGKEVGCQLLLSASGRESASTPQEELLNCV